jgi:hypothetical protein
MSSDKKPAAGVQSIINIILYPQTGDESAEAYHLFITSSSSRPHDLPQGKLIKQTGSSHYDLI